jgi:hypothetical protein
MPAGRLGQGEMAMIIERAQGFVEFPESRAIEAIWLSPSKEMLAISIKGQLGQGWPMRLWTKDRLRC